MEIKNQIFKIAGILIFLPFLLLAQTPKYSKVKINLGEKSIADVAKLGIAVDHGELKKGAYFISDLSEMEIDQLKSNGFKYEILVPDVIKHYEEQKQKQKQKQKRSQGSNSGCGLSPGNDYLTPVNFSLGSMGGFLTYDEMIQELDKMANLYPNLITSKQVVSSTHFSIEGRPLYYVKISDNPGNDETEPQVLYTAMHHAREPASMQQLIFYMYYLLENYATNSEVKSIVDDTELYFIPCLNPDGYIHNETTNPLGGGMWRKNRRDNNDGTYGVDLNRNYGMYWGYDNNGSSPSTGAATYRGTQAFSEPETKAIKDFCEAHAFKFALNYHSYGNLLIYPWGHEPSAYTPDSALFVNYAELLTRENDYTFGTGDQTVGYVVNGDSDDWMYGEESSKPKIFSMTPEVGSSFWPQESEIIDICKANIAQNLYTAKAVGRLAYVNDLNESLLTSSNGFLKFNIQRLGLDSPATFTVMFDPLSANITFSSPAKTFTGLSLMQIIEDSVSFTLSPNIQQGEEIKYSISINNGIYTSVQTYTRIYGLPVILAQHEGNSLAEWLNDAWGLDYTNYYSSEASMTDSPNGNYDNYTQKTLVYNSNINLVNSNSAFLSFWTRWDIETRYDYAQVLVSPDNGSSWYPLCGKYTRPGSIYQDHGNPIYDGRQATWVKEEIDLKDFIGQNIKISFSLITDDYVTADGFYIDDFKVVSVETSTGLKEVNNFDLLNCFPSPAIGSVSFYFNLPERNAQLIIMNSLGEKVNELNIKGNSLTIDVSDLPVGVYYYKIISAKGNSATKKMIIVR